MVKGYEQSRDPMCRDPRVVDVEGGFSGLAKAVSVTGGKGADALRQALELLRAVDFRHPDVEIGGLLTFTLYPAKRGRPARLRIMLNDPLMPAFAARLTGRTISARRARKLVPVPLREPPYHGPPKYHPAQCSLQGEVMAELRTRARELADTGAGTIAEARWLEMAEAVGLPASMLPAVLELWTAEGPAAFLVRRGCDGYTLAQAYEREMQTILEGGQDEIDGAAFQRRSARARKPFRSAARRLS